VIQDTVFDKNMKVVFTGSPDTVLRRLKHRVEEGWTKVFIGESERIVSIEQYLFREKFDAVAELVRETVRKSKLPLYERRPERLEGLIGITVRQIFNEIDKE
jgi:hypothetical protein